MDQIENISQSFDEALKDPDLHHAIQKLSKIRAKELIEDGLLDSIPLLNSIVSITKTGINIHDRLFLKKITHFLSNLSDIDHEKRMRLISKIDSSKEFDIKVGEKLIYIIDQSSDHVSAEYIARFFRCFLTDKITYSEFLRGATVIQKVYIEDLKEFLNTPFEKITEPIKPEDNIPDEILNYINAGLCGMITNRIQVNDQPDFSYREKFTVKGGDTKIYITLIGHLIKGWM